MVHYEKGGLFSYDPSLISTWYLDQQRATLVSTPLSALKCPSSKATHLNLLHLGVGVAGSQGDLMAAVGSYAGCAGSVGVPDTVHPSGSNQFRNTGLFLFKIKRKRGQITDGTSSTIAMGEATEEDTWNGWNTWAYADRGISVLRNTRNPLNTRAGNVPDPNSTTKGTLSDCTYATGNPFAPCWNGAFGSEHSGGANFVFIDGHVQFISENISMTTYQAISTIAGSLAPDPPEGPVGSIQ
jgi:prepilin-type processing-associated H-X9-DG protein